MKKEKLIKQLQEHFQASESATSERRNDYIEEQRFGDGSQWTDQDLAERAGRPCITINKLIGSIKQISGDARRNTPNIKVRPVDTQADPKIAKLFTGLIKDIERTSNARAAYIHGLECALRGGFGAWRIVTDYAEGNTFDQDIFIKRIVNPLSVYMDENSVEPDYSDARYAFVTESIPVEVFTKKYPKAALTSFDEYTADNWITDDSVRVAEYFWKEDYKAKLYELEDGSIIELKKSEEATIDEADAESPSGTRTTNYVIGDDMEQPIPFLKSRSVTRQKVRWCITNGVDILDGPNEWAGRYIPIIICGGEEIWLENKRVYRSLVHHAKDAQRLYNWSRSNTVETLAQAPKQPYLLTPDEVEGHEAQWDSAHKTPQAYRLFNEVGLGRPQPSAPSIPNTGAYREAAVSTDDIKATTGVYDASLGAQGNETSGLAIRSRQAQASNSAYVYIDNQASAIMYTAKQLVDLIPKIYDTERVVRLLNEDGTEAWQIINQIDPNTGQVMGNDISVGRYDVAYDVGPSFITKRQEAAEGLLKVAQTAPQFMPMIMPDVAKNLDWPGAEELAAKFAELNKPKPPAPDVQLKLKELETKVQVEQMKAQIDQQKANADLELKKLDYQSKLLDLQIKQLEAKTNDDYRRVDIAGKQMDLENKHRDRQYNHISQRVDLASKNMDIKNKQLDMANKAMDISKKATDTETSGIVVTSPQ